MKWIGKIGGGVLGFVAAGPVGGLVGALLGHQFDRGLATAGARIRRRSSRHAFSDLSNTARQQVFFETTFLVMGHMAKADGHVSEAEIQSARTVMHQMHLRPEHVRRAIDLFSRGKRADFALDEQVATMREACGRHSDLIRTFMEIQLEMVLSKGSIHAAERDSLWRIADNLGMGRVELAQLEAILRARRSFRGGHGAGAERQNAIDQAYKALGISSDAAPKEIKTAYRRLMNQHHPDKLVARGLPDSMLEGAKERTREIRSAYELVRDHREFK
jgi:DnaJ like chaperone protein